MVRTPSDPPRFADRVLADTSAAGTIALAAIGDRLGLFKDLARRGPATPEELGARTGLSTRHLAEWLAALTSAGYLARDTQTGRYALPEAHAAALAQEDHPDFLGGAHEALLGFLKPLDRIVETFRTRGGVPQSAYPDHAYEGMDRFTAAHIERALVSEWLPAAGLTGRLVAGARVADVGCGRGRALLRLAREYPESRFTGFDLYGPNIAHAKAAALEGCYTNLRFFHRDAAEGLSGPFDLVTTFGVVHEAVDPLALLRSIRQSLAPKGVWLCSEPLPREAPAPMTTFLLAASVLHGLSTSLAHGGAALGAFGLSEERLTSLAAAAGFARPRRIPVEGSCNGLWALDPIL
jgi:2-polyprenyl-3-methyl-5-hydroxy-6-metoxy-1,4-benzoquinol methylase